VKENPVPQINSTFDRSVLPSGKLTKVCFPGSAIVLHLPTIGVILATCLKPEKDPEVKLKIFTVLSSNIVCSEELKQASGSGTFMIKLVKGT